MDLRPGDHSVNPFEPSLPKTSGDDEGHVQQPDSLRRRSILPRGFSHRIDDQELMYSPNQAYVGVESQPTSGDEVKVDIVYLLVSKGVNGPKDSRQPVIGSS